MIYLRSKKIFVFFLAFLLLFIFEGFIPLKFFPARNEKEISRETALLYQKINDLEQRLQEHNFADKSILANIIFGGGYIFSDSILLDRGLEYGIAKGDFVIYKSSIAVAKIDEVFSGYSKAVPFSRFGEKITLRSGPQKSVLFEAEGGGGREIVASLPKGSLVNVGDGVYLAENPRFLAGIVEMATKRESRDFEEINVLLPLSLWSIVEVSIIKNYVE